MKTINIIGGGPAGCYLAYLLSNKFQVNVYEEHKSIGQPVQCTGIVTSSINNVVNIPKDIIINKINKIIINGEKEKTEIKLKKPDLILNRKEFDKYFYKKAKKNNVKFFLDHKLTRIEKNIIFLKNKNKIIKKEKEILIGADGPNSIVSKYLGNKNNYYIGIQEVIKNKNNNEVEVFLKHGKFGWIVPENKLICRKGIMANKKNAKKIFNNFTKKKKKKKLQAGLIPIYNTKEIYNKKLTYIVGDAASLVKATTGGGIIQGLISSKILANCLINKKNYKKELKKIRKELWLHLMTRKILDKLNKKDIDYLIKIISKKKNKKILETIGRDNLIKMILRLVISEPRLILFAMKKIPIIV